MKPKRRVGIFGGTFNPPHNGHVKAAEEFLSQAALDYLYIIPACVPPHKENADVAFASDRFNMCKLAFGRLNNTEISDIEIKRGGRSYTYETLMAFDDEKTELFFLCGTDMFLTLDTWHSPDVIFNIATICVIRRERDTTNTKIIQAKISDYKERFNAKILSIEADALELSSTYIRKLILSGESVSAYLPSTVYDFIFERGLYQ